MKTIIVYATKHGAAGILAQRIAEKMKGAVVCNLEKDNVNLDEYECVIIGSSVYAGRARKQTKEFISKNMENLLKKKVGLFLSCLETVNEKTYFESNYPPEILQAAKAKCSPGGIFDPKKAGAIERLIIKIIKKKVNYIDTIDNIKIDQFVKALNEK